MVRLRNSPCRELFEVLEKYYTWVKYPFSSPNLNVWRGQSVLNIESMKGIKSDPLRVANEGLFFVCFFSSSPSVSAPLASPLSFAALSSEYLQTANYTGCRTTALWKLPLFKPGLQPPRLPVAATPQPISAKQRTLRRMISQLANGRTPTAQFGSLTASIGWLDCHLLNADWLVIFGVYITEWWALFPRSLDRRLRVSPQTAYVSRNSLMRKT